MSHVRKPKLVEQRLALHSRYVVSDPAALRGRWRSLAPHARELHVDLGCGKGLWTTRAAREHPDTLFVGVDIERMCVSFAAEQAARAGIDNAFFLIDAAHGIESLFAPGEVDVIHANFPTPFPRKKDALSRVTDARWLMSYRRILGPDGLLCLKTDSQPLFDFTLEQLEAAGYDLIWSIRDLQGERPGETGERPNQASKLPSEASGLNHACRFAAPTASAAAARFATASLDDATALDDTASLDDVTAPGKVASLGEAATAADTAHGPLPFDLIASAYERKLTQRGARIHALRARPGAEPARFEPRDAVSLLDYLPDDLESIEYAPLGMEDAIENMRNRRRNAAAKLERHAARLAQKP